MSDEMMKRIKEGKMASGYNRTAGGKRADLDNVYFRSSWEANYARFLNLIRNNGDIDRWEYEPHVFFFEAIKQGTRTYKPDFKVYLKNGSYEWHEVKGWMDNKSKTRLSRMAKYYPEEKIILIDESWFRSAYRKGLNKLIPHWEHGNKSRGTRGC